MKIATMYHRRQMKRKICSYFVHLPCLSSIRLFFFSQFWIAFHIFSTDFFTFLLYTQFNRNKWDKKSKYSHQLQERKRTNCVFAWLGYKSNYRFIEFCRRIALVCNNRKSHYRIKFIVFSLLHLRDVVAHATKEEICIQTCIFFILLADLFCLTIDCRVTFSAFKRFHERNFSLMLDLNEKPDVSAVFFLLSDELLRQQTPLNCLLILLAVACLLAHFFTHFLRSFLWMNCVGDTLSGNAQEKNKRTHWFRPEQIQWRSYDIFRFSSVELT